VFFANSYISKLNHKIKKMTACIGYTQSTKYYPEKALNILCFIYKHTINETFYGDFVRNLPRENHLIMLLSKHSFLTFHRHVLNG